MEGEIISILLCALFIAGLIDGFNNNQDEDEDNYWPDKYTTL